MSILHEPSEEQKEIILHLKENNVVVQAVASSGKTTTSLHIAKYFSDCKILLLTYNAHLKSETRKKVGNLGLKNIEVHSFHAFGLKYYQETKCITDNGLSEIIKQQQKPKVNIGFQIIIDESQDIKPLFYEFVCKVINDNILNAKICLLGDKNQSIYSYEGADSRYITLASKLFDFNEYSWKQCTLSESFRVNDKVINFINEVFYQKPLMKSTKISQYKPEYIIANVYESEELYKKIKKEIETWGYDNIFLLAPSVLKDKTPIKCIANKLSRDGIPVYVPSNDDEKLEEKFLKGKLVFSTFHQAKGLERKLVIVFNFDNGYYKYYNHDSNPMIPANPLYVAITRSLEKLILIHNYNQSFLKFLDVKKLFSYCQGINYLNSYETNCFKRKMQDYDDNFNYQASSISVVDLVRHVPSNIVKNCMEKIKVEDYINQDFPQTTVLNLKDYVQEKGFIEQVSNITGIAIPLYYEWHCKKDLKKVSSLNLLLNFLKERRDYTKEEYPDLFKHEKFIKGLYENEKLPVKDLLLLANIWIYIVDKFNFKLNQISNENYNWITEENLSNFMQLMEYHISTGSAFEQPYTHSKVAELYDKTLNGFIDCIDFKSKNVWEFKCVSRVTDVHFLQLAVYAYLFEIKQQERVSILNKKANDIFSLNKIEINDIIEICKWNQVYFANFQRFKQNKIIILKDNKIKKVKLKHFQKNITLEKKFNVNRKTFTSKYNFFLFNILKNKIYRLSFEFSDLKKIVDLLVWNKFFESGTMTDIEFMSSNQKIKDRYIYNWYIKK